VAVDPRRFARRIATVAVDPRRFARRVATVAVDPRRFARRIATVIALLVLVLGVSAAQPQPASQKKRVIQPEGYRPSPAPLSPAILVGDTLYLSGSTGGDPRTGELVKGGFEPEMRQIMSNVQTVLKTAGMDLSDVVAVTAYLADMADYARFNEIYREYFASPPLPTRSTVAVKELARGARIELTMTAVRTR
jgi:2-iminobutanoate/2-iminopropanoate deaminase